MLPYNVKKGFALPIVIVVIALIAASIGVFANRREDNKRLLECVKESTHETTEGGSVGRQIRNECKDKLEEILKAQKSETPEDNESPSPSPASTPTATPSPSPTPTPPIGGTNALPPPTPETGPTCTMLEKDSRGSGEIISGTTTSIPLNTTLNIIATIINDNGKRDNSIWSTTGGTFATTGWDYATYNADKSGTFNIKYTLESIDQTSCSVTINVVAPSPEPFPVPVPAKVATLPVLVLNYMPQTKNGRLDKNITGIDDTIDNFRIYVSKLTAEVAAGLTSASRYHGYNDQSAPPSVSFSLADSKEYLEALPVSTNKLYWSGAYRPDYKKILNRINICNYVDNKRVRQVWLWGYHYGNIEPVESNMAMGRISQKYWNHGTYGDVSNSEQTDDLPTCNNTYVLLNYNYDRGAAEAIHDHGHLIEWILNWTEDRDKTSETLWPSLMFWGKFVGSDKSHKIIRPGCGWIHYPPNGVQDYDYANTKEVQSNCLNWKPDGTSQKTGISCKNWGCTGDPQKNFIIWWMQNLPGHNNGLRYGTNYIKNWWTFYGDFDKAAKNGIGLYSAQVQGAKDQKSFFENLIDYLQNIF